MNKTKTKNPRKVKGVIAYHLPKKKKNPFMLHTDTNEQQPKKLAFIAFALFIK